MGKLNEFLVTNFPKVWRSKIIYILMGSILAYVFFYFFVDNFDTELHELKEKSFSYEKDHTIFGYPPLFICTCLLFVWLYFQYNNNPVLRKITIIEVCQGVILNTVCIFFLFLPLYPLFKLTIDDALYLTILIETFLILSYILFLPSIFLPFFFKFYSLLDVILVIIFTILYSICVTYVVDMFDMLSIEYTSPIAIIHYILILVYMIVKLQIKRYNKTDKWLIFFLIGAAPWFIGFVIGIILGEEYPIPYSDIDLDEPVYFISTLSSYVFLIFLTWFVTKSLRKPIVIN